MKILLAIAPYKWNEIYPDFQSKKTGLKLGGKYGLIPGTTAPLGIMYLSSVLKNNGYDVSFLDGALYSYREWYSKIIEYDAEIIGLHCATFSWERVRKISKRLRNDFPDVFIVTGGPHPTHSGRKILEEENSIDISFMGDAEEAILSVCEQLKQNKKDFSGIDNIVWRKGEEIIQNSYNPIDNLDIIPYPDYNLVDLNQYSPSIGFYKDLPSINIIASRGCRSDCSFCIASRSYRPRSINDVIGELEYAVKDFKVRHAIFYDENLMDSKERITTLCETLIEKKLPLSWCCNARSSSIEENSELLGLMKKAGCWRILIGIESGSDRILKLMNKEETKDQIKNSINLVNSAKIESFGTIIFGYPTETFEDGVETIKFCCDSSLSYLSILNYVPFPGCEYSIYRSDIRKYGRITGLYSMKSICFIPNSMTEDEMIKLNLMAYKKFYMRPAYLVRRFLAIRGFEDIKRNIRGFSAFRRANYNDLRPDTCLNRTLKF